MAKSSLAEQIAALSAPQTDFDIEDNDFRQSGFDDDDDNDGSDSGVDNEGTGSQHYVNVEKSHLRRNADNVKLGGKYKGAVTSRQSLLDDEASASGSEIDEDSQMEDNSQQSDDDSQHSDDDSDSGESLRSNSSDESDNDHQHDEDLDAKRAKLKSLMSQERKHIVNRLSQSTTNDSIKGFAILQQHKLFDSIIDTRLKLQKAVTNSNLLPASHDALSHEDLATSKTESLVDSATDKCYTLLNSIFKLRSKLLQKDNVTDTPVSHNPKKRTLTAYSQSTNDYDAIVNKYRASVLMKWSAKIQNSSGSTAMNSGKFKAINQNAEQQVSNNLSDMDRLIKRTKLNRRQIKPLAIDYYLQQHKDTDQVKDQAEAEDEENYNTDIPRDQQNGHNSKPQTLELDTIFDDEDFYRVLLNDLVDKKIQSSNPASGLTYALRSAQQAHKLKKNVDTKASKGRKLRYQVQEPIANFEAPTGNWKWNDDQIDEFFASLLGQKVNMNEVDSEGEQDDAEDAEDLVLDGDNAIKLFG